MDSCCLCCERIIKSKINELDNQIKEILTETLRIEVNLREGKRICWRCLTLCKGFLEFKIEVKGPTAKIKDESGGFFQVLIPEFGCLVCGINNEPLVKLFDLTAFKAFFPSVQHDMVCEYCLNTVTSFYTFYKKVIGKQIVKPAKPPLHLVKVKDENLIKKLQSTNVAEKSRWNIQMKTLDPEYVCDLCQVVLSTKENLETHFKIVHIAKNFACNLCNKTFGRRYRLNYHMLFMHKEMDPKCLYCDKTLPTRRAMTQHIYDEHTSDAFKCRDCGKRFRTQVKYDVHIEKQLCKQPNYEARNYTYKPPPPSLTPPKLEKKLACEVCSEQFASGQSLKRHKVLRHSHAVKRYICDGCDGLFKIRQTMLQHKKICKRVVRTQNKKIDGYLCEKCDLCFAKLDETLKHQERCTGQPLKKSETVGRVAKGLNEQELADMELNVSKSGDGRFVCRLCCAPYVAKRSYYRHYVQYHHVKAVKKTESVVMKAAPNK